MSRTPGFAARHHLNGDSATLNEAFGSRVNFLWTLYAFLTCTGANVVLGERGCRSLHRSMRLRSSPTSSAPSWPITWRSNALELSQAVRRAVRSAGALIAVAGAGLHWLAALPTWLGVGLCLAAPAWAWFVELRCDWRLARRLDEVPERAAVSGAVTSRARKS